MPRVWLQGVMLAVGWLVPAGGAWCCSMATPHQFSFFLSENPALALSYGQDADEPMVMSGCSREDARKFLLLTLGPDIISPDFRRSSSFDGNFKDAACKISGDPFASLQSHEQRLDLFQEQSRTLSHCIGYDIEVKGRPPRLARQEACTIERLAPDHLIAFGAYCYLPIGIQSEYSIKPFVREECLQRSYLAELNVSPMDFGGIIGSYISGDASGHSVDLVPLEFTDLRFTYAADPQLLKQTVQFDKRSPRWPTTAAATVQLGPFDIKIKDRDTRFTSRLLVDNRCHETCFEGVCSSPCRYMAPVGVQTSIYEIQPSRKVLLESWYEAAVAPAMWQGSIPIKRRLRAGMFATDKLYRLVYDFTYSDSYFRLARADFGQLLIDMDLISGEPGVGTIEPLAALRSLNRRFVPLPNLEGPTGILGGMSFEDPIAHSLATLGSMIYMQDWPPYYLENCTQELNQCWPVYPRRPKSEESVDFRISAIASNDSAEITVLDHTRLSTVAGALTNIEELPDVYCP